MKQELWTGNVFLDDDDEEVAPSPTPLSTRVGLAGLCFCSILGAAFAVLYATNTWPFEQKSWLDCSLRVAHASFFNHAMSPGNADDDVIAMAQDLLPIDLMNGTRRWLEEGRTPRLIHQSWKDRDPPRRFRHWSASWRRHHPNWSYVLWTDADNLELLRRFYPEYLEAYHALPSEIYRADMVRNCYMHLFGGIYADLDVESLRPLDDLLDHPTAVNGTAIAYVARMDTTGDLAAEPNAIPNAFMASTAPRHPFWLGPLSYILRHISDHLNEPEWLTGPVPLGICTRTYEPSDAAPLIVLDPSSIYPYSWSTATAYQHCICSAQAPTLDTARCKSLWSSAAYAITYWSQSWLQANWVILGGRRKPRRRSVISNVSPDLAAAAPDHAI